MILLTYSYRGDPAPCVTVYSLVLGKRVRLRGELPLEAEKKYFFAIYFWENEDSCIRWLHHPISLENSIVFVTSLLSPHAGIVNLKPSTPALVEMYIVLHQWPTKCINCILVLSCRSVRCTLATLKAYTLAGVMVHRPPISLGGGYTKQQSLDHVGILEYWWRKRCYLVICCINRHGHWLPVPSGTNWLTF